MTTTFFQPLNVPPTSSMDWSESERSGLSRRRSGTTAQPTDDTGLRGLPSFGRTRSLSLPEELPVEETEDFTIDIDTPVSKCIVYTTQVLERMNSSERMVQNDEENTSDEDATPRPTETWLEEVLSSQSSAQDTSSETETQAAPLPRPLAIHEPLSILHGPKNLTSNRTRGSSVASYDGNYMRPRPSSVRAGGGDTSVKLHTKSSALLNFPRNTRRFGASIGSSLGQTLVNSTPEPSMTPSLSFDGSSSMQKKMAFEDSTDSTSNTRVSMFDFGSRKSHSNEPKKPNPVAIAFEKICHSTPSSPARKEKSSKKWWDISNKQSPRQEKKMPLLSQPNHQAIPKKSILVATPPTPTRVSPPTIDDTDDDIEQDTSIFSSLRNVDLVSSFIRDSKTKDESVEEDIAKALEEDKAPEEEEVAPVTPCPVASAAPSILKPPTKRPMARGNANMVAFLGGYKQTQNYRGTLKLGVASDIASRAKNIRKRTAETALQRQLTEARSRIPPEFQDMSGVIVKEKRNKDRSVHFASDDALEDIYVFEVIEPEDSSDDCNHGSEDEEHHVLVDL
ncbi:hypothetical protein THRCLA_06446 [Thraustotheca clavata]|uniref:Uncharacterized protein n=1 Tax=Thraustotheca clavata TaxID=74557 RepID=A0A1V9ZNQ3_9STRA|nr:hypothetical protein THRCLA_06446 [Thraustotheca clavata]